ncbi:unnamed protein product [Clonostachys rosea]|uniref:NACHT domain-containing protein n=1 Tax=Bionectria ochroleuca TaxID=29856 RepID=A0ABY6TYD6_BIOOC|nr:unnamed protein product [Clonostachys rosea]
MPKSFLTADEYDIVNHEETALSPEVLAQIRDWLQPTDYLAESGEFRRHLSSQAPGTGLWLCQTEEYRKWHDSPDHGSLWIKGVPGAGKSVVAAAIIQHLRLTEECPVLFFFFRNIVAANFSPRALLRDWLAQLLPHSPKLQYALQTRLESELSETSDNDLIQLFLDGVSCVPKLYCVGDALDEMTMENKSFLDRLNSLATHRPRSLKLLMTSRPKQYLQSALRDSSIVHVSLQQKLVDIDIVSFLNHRFDSASKLETHKIRKEQIIDMVAKKSEGLFLYAKLTMDQVEAALDSDSSVDLQSLEDSLPVGLQETYNNILATQREERGVRMDVQILVLEAVTHASRPLRLNELAHLLKCIYPDAADPSGFKSLVTASCGPLIEILEDETLQVIHHSFTEFLRGDTRSQSLVSGDTSTEFPIIDSDMTHKHLALYCLRYLQYGSLLVEGETSDSASITFQVPQHKVNPDEDHEKYSRRGVKREYDHFKYRDARLKHPFLSYSVENWSYHASRYDRKDEQMFRAVLGFLNPDSLAFRRWLVLQWGSTTRDKESTDGIPTALHIAAFSGMSELVLELIQKGSSVASLDAQDRIPLHWAAANGHAKTASLLIQHGSEPNAVDGRGLKPIHLAAKRNHHSVVTVLLEAGVEPNTTKTKEDHSGRLLGGEKITRGECAIMYAAQGGHTETIISMIPFCNQETLEQLLCECCRYNRTDSVMEILKRSKVSADAMYCGGTALYLACRQFSLECIKALIKRGADVNKLSAWAPRPIMNGRGRRKEVSTAPIHWIIQEWREENQQICRTILKLLIDAGADLEQLNGEHLTALHLAAKGRQSADVPAHCQMDMLRMLLEAGVSPKTTGDNGNTALHLIVGPRLSLGAVQLLVEYGSDPNHKNSSGETSLHLALQSRSKKQAKMEAQDAVIKYLLEEGADPNIEDNKGNSAVQAAMSVSAELFKTLLSNCHDDAVKQNCWFGLSRYDTEFSSCLQVLLEEGIDINVQDPQGLTLYMRSLWSSERLSVLEKYKARVDIPDNLGNNALHLAVRQPSISRIEYFVKRGLDPLSVNNDGNTLIHLAALNYRYDNNSSGGNGNPVKLFEYLVNLGISVNAVNKDGQTALHLYESRDDLESRKANLIDALNCKDNVKYDIKDRNGLTALHLAAMRSVSEFNKLVECGADWTTLTSESQNIWHLICRARKPEILGQLLERLSTFGIEQRDRYGKRPLYYACSSGEPESVALLLNKGARVKVTDLEGETPLHACAYFRVEQSIWDTQGQRFFKWRQGPPKDIFRPGSSQRPYSIGPWYRHTYTDGKAVSRKTFFPSVITIIKMLRRADIDVATVNDSGYTALDVALQIGCAEFIEVFSRDENLLTQATKNLEDEREGRLSLDEAHRRMQAQMILMQQRSALDTLGKDKALLDEVVNNPTRYLNLISYEDLAVILNQGFEANSQNPVYHKFISEAINSENLEILERIPELVKHYGLFSSLEEMLQSDDFTRAHFYDTPAFNALQMACKRSKISLVTVKLLVEHFELDPDARAAVCRHVRSRSSVQIIEGGTALHVLASADEWWHLEAIRYLISKGADVNAQDERGCAPLHLAAKGKHVENNVTKGSYRLNAVRILLDYGADPNALDKSGLSPLHKASGALNIMQELLRRGADPNIGSLSPLFMAIKDANFPAFEILLDQGLSVDSLDEVRHSRDVHYSLKESRKLYALVCCAFSNGFNNEILKSVPLLCSLVKRGANLYLPVSDKETLIHFLFEFPDYPILDALLSEECKARIDFDHRDQQGRTVLMAACDWFGSLPRGGRKDPKKDPFLTGPPLRILDCGANATLVDDEGMTALHHLLANNDMVDDVLIDFINRDEVAPTLFLKDKQGFSPFHYALRTLRPKICELLLSKGADISEADPNGLTVLHHIANQRSNMNRRSRRFSGSTNTLPADYFDECLSLWERYIHEGGSINAVDNGGNTPLHLYLLSRVAGHRPEHRATFHLDYYDEFFPPDSGVDVFASNNEGETALHLIARRQKEYMAEPGYDKSLFEEMMAKGLDPLKEDAQGRSALDVASAFEKDDIVGLLGRT